ncbi:histone H1-like [Forsythia ovata]|uniref:Histone H1-like n=1 Tax=Forsythia ovata TaxID=205694 RepID=A0ABD1QMJ9_9LAMI
MITVAIAGLKEKNGSSRRAIAKYMETQYTNLPPTHNLKRLKNNGQIVMVKHSYKLPRSALVLVSGNGTVNVLFYLNSAGSKRKHGHPPKPQPVPIQNDVLVFVHGVQNSMATVSVSPPNMAVGQGAMYVSVGSVNWDAPAVGVGVKRGRGRPAAEVTKELVLSHLMPV